MTLNRVKLEWAVTFMKYFASVFSLMFRAEILIWNKTTFAELNVLNLAELVKNGPTKSFYKKFTNIPFYI